MAETRGKPGPRRTLTEQEILDAALALLDTGRSGAASIRRIAAAVGVAPNAVYTYFPDKTAVDRALVELILAEVTAELTGGWRARVEALAVDLRRQLIAHPGAVPLLLGGPLDGPNSLRLGESLLGLLAAGGLDPASAARGSYLLMVYVLGAVALEVDDVPPGMLAPEAERIAARRAALCEVPAQAFPRMAAATGVLAASIGTEQFRWGLRRLLDGLQAEAELN
ncbi:TetR/AcrR family transcriptional regulator [Actinoplanes subtropicus]|uniref:TetR/AcrR family transcriptional regulator n=1 Tax=Actinoplanes subtropicus TaxID=543632 RepID=UPI0005599680|nr:TetR/AcrR family transcriptional regulator [Actinoplanes subtropicus]